MIKIFFLLLDLSKVAEKIHERTGKNIKQTGILYEMVENNYIISFTFINLNEV